MERTSKLAELVRQAREVAEGCLSLFILCAKVRALGRDSFVRGGTRPRSGP